MNPANTIDLEPVSEAQWTALQGAVIKAHGHVGLMISGVSDADLTAGRGIIEKGVTYCLWTSKKHRITITTPREGGLIVSCSKNPDPQFDICHPKQ